MFGRKRAAVPSASAGVPRWPLDAWRGRALNADDPEYVALCLTPAFPEEPEMRSLRDGDGLTRIMAVAKTDGVGTPAMARLVNELLVDSPYANLDVLYSWLAPVYEGTNRELEVIGQGLRTCPRKYRVLDLAGSAMLRRGRGADAFYYWAQAVTNAESLGEGPEARAYDFLIVVAQVIGQRGAAETFAARTGEDDWPQVSLDDEYTGRVEKAFRKPTKAVKTVIQTLAERISG